MRAGPLDRKVTIQRRFAAQNSFGEEIVEWQDVCPPLWAEKVSSPGNERYVQAQFVGKSVTSFRVRWQRALKEIGVKHRVLFEGRAFDILDVQEIGRCEGLLLHCEARSESPIAA